MHQSAMFYARVFFETYFPESQGDGISIVEVGSQNINGSIRETSPVFANYLGLDFVDGIGVDKIIEDPYHLPLPDKSADVVVSSSCFEHAQLFWLSYLEIMRVLKDDGILYLNVPSNGIFHRYPVDCWRFYPDAGKALIEWGRRSGFESVLLESFIGDRSEEGIWNDYVGVFIKDGKYLSKYRNRMVNSLPRVYEAYTSGDVTAPAEEASNPDYLALKEMKSNNEAASAALAAHAQEIEKMRAALKDSESKNKEAISQIHEKNKEISLMHAGALDRDDQVKDLLNALSATRGELANLERQVQLLLSSKSWKLTQPLRYVQDAIAAAYDKTFRRFLFLSKEDGRTEGARKPNESITFVPKIEGPPFQEKLVKIICFYLPQFHRIPENDKWWGNGFTEWTNVRPALPQFEGHYQPHIPGDLGYYNLLSPEIFEQQVDIAKIYGIEGFCFYYYWFGGERLLEKPLDLYLNKKELDLSFCLCWANENWTRRWDGLEKDILIAQNYSIDDDIKFISDISKFFEDSRYIRIAGKPLLLIYRPSLLPDPEQTAKRWRTWCLDNGVGEIYLAYTQSFEKMDPAQYGFDAAVEFPPNISEPPEVSRDMQGLNPDFSGNIFDWSVLPERSRSIKEVGYKIFRGINPSWDNTARKKNRATIFVNSSPVGYQRWLTNLTLDLLRKNKDLDERLIFVNAWNEWAEGAHLEPDQRYGYAYLEATKLAQVRSSVLCGERALQSHLGLAIIIHAYYPDVLEKILARMPVSLKEEGKLFLTTSSENKEAVIRVANNYSVDYELFIFKNRGRDVLPFLKAAGKVAELGYKYILKLHTKKSLHRGDGERWREKILDELFDDALVHNIFSYFNRSPSVGMVGPAGNVFPLKDHWGSNMAVVHALGERLGLVKEQICNAKFAAGTMFYSRVDALRPLLNIAVNEDHFAAEKGQLDGTLAHALERAFPLSALSVGMDIVSTADVKMEI